MYGPEPGRFETSRSASPAWFWQELHAFSRCSMTRKHTTMHLCNQIARLKAGEPASQGQRTCNSWKQPVGLTVQDRAWHRPVSQHNLSQLGWRPLFARCQSGISLLTGIILLACLDILRSWPAYWCEPVALVRLQQLKWAAASTLRKRMSACAVHVLPVAAAKGPARAPGTPCPALGCRHAVHRHCGTLGTGACRCSPTQAPGTPCPAVGCQRPLCRLHEGR